MHCPKTITLAGLAVLVMLLAVGTGCTKKRIYTDPPPKHPETETVGPTAAATGAETTVEVISEDLESEPLPEDKALEQELAQQDEVPELKPVTSSQPQPGPQPEPAPQPTVQETAQPGPQSTTVSQIVIGNYDQTGLASWIADENRGLPTASGELYDPSKLTAAHRTLPLGSVIGVTNLENGRVVEVRVNDRGPFKKERVVDLSRAAAEALGMIDKGVVQVGLTIRDKPAQVETPAPVQGAYYVQVGAYSNKAAADAVLDQLVKAGYEESRVMLPAGEAVYRVQAGAFKDEAEARSALDFLREQFPDSYLITD